MPGATGVPHPERAPRAPGRRPLAARRAPPEGAAGRGRRGRVAGSRVGDRGAASALPTRVPRGVSGAGVTVLSRPACPGAPLPPGERPAVPSPQCGASSPAASGRPLPVGWAQVCRCHVPSAQPARGNRRNGYPSVSAALAKRLILECCSHEQSAFLAKRYFKMCRCCFRSVTVTRVLRAFEGSS